MNDNLNDMSNPNVMAEVNDSEMIEEITETVEITANLEMESADMTVQESDEMQEIQENQMPVANQESNESDESNMTVGTEESIEAIEDNEKTAKKKIILRFSVIVALCLVIAVLLGYFTYVGFILKEPEGITWSEEVDGTTYYYEFKNDGTFVASVGSVEVNSTYQKTKGDDGDTIVVDNDFGSLIANVSVTYTITGSRILGNQTLNGTYGEGDDFTLHQSSKKIITPDLPEDFTPDEGIVGTWLFKYMEYDVYKVTFDNKGSMMLEVVQDGIKYNGVYTIDSSTINFTYCLTENVNISLEYTLVDPDNMIFMNYSFVREGSAAASP